SGLTISRASSSLIRSIAQRLSQTEIADAALVHVPEVAARMKPLAVVAKRRHCGCRDQVGGAERRRVRAAHEELVVAAVDLDRPGRAAALLPLVPPLPAAPLAPARRTKRARILSGLELPLEVAVASRPRPGQAPLDPRLEERRRQACSSSVPVVFEPPADVLRPTDVVLRMAERRLRVQQVDGHGTTPATLSSRRISASIRSRSFRSSSRVLAVQHLRVVGQYDVGLAPHIRVL